MPATFVGWIPNAAGRLSFSHIGQTRHPAPCRTFNEDDGVCRRLVCAQKRVLSDALVAAGWFNFIYGYDPRWQFVLLAQSEAVGEDQRAKLVGEVFIFNTARWAAGASNRVAGFQLLDQAIEISEGLADGEPCELAHAADQLGPPRFPKPLSEVAQRLREAAVYSVACQIDRTGIVRLQESGHAEVLRFTPTVTLKAQALDPQAERYLCNQAYFFLKDIAHTHRHHHKRADTITAAYPEDGRGGWIRGTQYSMHRRVVGLRRSASALTLYDTLGLMAYMKSFHEIVDQLPASAGKAVIQKYNLKETEDSIKAQLEGSRWKRVQLNLILTAIPTLILALAGLFRPGAADLNATATLFDFVRSGLAALFPPNWKGLLATLVLAATVPFIYGAADPTRLNTVQRAKRLWLLWSLRRQTIIGLTVAGGFLVVAGVATSLALLGRAKVDLVWVVTLISLVATVLAFLLLPYLLTLPDLLRLLRTYPHRPDLSQPT